MKKLIIDKASGHSLDFPDMDKTHFEFIDLVNRLGHAKGDDFRTLFAVLFEHTKKHFDHENQLMQEFQFPAYKEHSGEHTRILGDMQQFLRRVEKGSITLARLWVEQQLPEWFQLHLKTMDAALVRHIKSLDHQDPPLQQRAL